MQTIDTRAFKVIDISKTVHPPTQQMGPDEIHTRVGQETLIWPIEQYNSAVDTSVYQIVKLKTHLGTHLEAPFHMYPKDGKTLSDFPADTWLGRMVNLKFDLGPNTIITLDVMKKVDNGRLKGNDIVLIHSTAKLEGDNPYNHSAPAVSREATEYLLMKRIKMFAFPSSISFLPAPDNAHDILLRNGIPILEWVTNLDKLTQDVAFLVAIPAFGKVIGIDSSPVQVVVIEGADFD